MAAAVLHTRSERFAEDICLKSIGSDRKRKRGRDKTVSWPLNEKLCEVRHFSADDAPSILGVAVQHILGSSKGSLLPSETINAYREPKHFIRYHPSEAKRARFTSVMKADGSVPPCFGLPMCKRPFEPKTELASMAIMAPWHHPHMFILDDAWLWAGGEESSEVSLQKQREMRLFEAFYPRLASIPDSPAEPLERCTEVLDSQVVLIPLEEEEKQDVEPVEMTENDCTENRAQELKEVCNLMNHGDYTTSRSNCADESLTLKQAKLSEADSNIAAVAAAACMVVKALGESDMVDEKLLLEILRNPSLLKSLTCSNQVTNNNGRLRNNGTASVISTEPMTGVVGKLLPDQGEYLNASPDSVLSRWEESIITGSPYGTSSASACGNANIWQPATADPEPTNPKLHVTSWLTSEACLSSNPAGFELPAKRALPETCMSSVFIPPNLHAHKVHVEERQLCQNGLRSNPCAPRVQSMCTLATSKAHSSAPSNLPSNTELPQKMVLRARLIRDPESQVAYTKETAEGGLSNLGGGGRAKRFCMYFNSPRGCRNGGSCAFLHQSLDSKLNTVAL